MKSFRSQFLRHFVLLLLTVFFTNTVFASGAMTSRSFQSTAESITASALQQQNVHTHQAAHCHDQDSKHVTSEHQNSHRSHDCHHCLACFSAISQTAQGGNPVKTEMIFSILFAQIYASPVALQPHKPPIL